MVVVRDVNLFNIHADFVLGVLLKQAWTADNVREYNKNYERDKPRGASEAVTVLGSGNREEPWPATTAAVRRTALRAVEIKADVLLKGTRVDGVYTDDPERNKKAKRYTSLSFGEALET